MRFAVTGGATIEAWCDNAHNLQRHFFNSPRRRTMQQANIFAATTPAEDLLS
jgi:hypothetical protein